MRSTAAVLLGVAVGEPPPPGDPYCGGGLAIRTIANLQQQTTNYEKPTIMIVVSAHNMHFENTLISFLHSYS